MTTPDHSTPDHDTRGHCADDRPGHGDRPVPGALAARLQELADQDVLVALDFDGVLAPLVDDPADSRVSPEAISALRRLAAAPRIRLALVSGRGAEELVGLAEVPEDTLVVGSHGAERGHVTGTGTGRRLAADDLALSPEQSRLRDEVLTASERIVAGAPGAWVERKPTGAAVHTRRCGPEDSARIAEATLTGPGRADGLRVRRGKDVVEMSVVHATKGEAVAGLRQQTGAGVVLYGGDDVTDEDAFAALGPADVGIKVGDGETAARFRVADPETLAAALTLLAEVAEHGAHPEM